MNCTNKDLNILDVKAKILDVNESNINYCAKKLKEGKLVSFSTETVYGLGANCFDKEAVLNIFKFKGRPLSDPLILHVYSIDQIYPLVEIDNNTKELLEDIAAIFWPGPLTVILKANKSKISNYITADTDYVSFRIPNHKDALELLRKVDFPIAAPSANKFCHVSPVSAYHVYDDFKEYDIKILNSGYCEFSMESSVIKPLLNEKVILIYRKGALTELDFKKFFNSYDLKYIDFKVEYFNKTRDINTDNSFVHEKDVLIDRINLIKGPTIFKDENIGLEEDDTTSSKEAPGQFNKHYSPLISTYICKFNKMTSKLSNNKLIKCIDLTSEVAKNAVIIDYNKSIINYIDTIKKEKLVIDYKPLEYYDLSPNNISFDAQKNLYKYLREAEKVKNAQLILVPDFENILDKENPYKSTLVDRVEKASSFNILYL